MRHTVQPLIAALRAPRPLRRSMPACLALWEAALGSADAKNRAAGFDYASTCAVSFSEMTLFGTAPRI